jgi:AcrR family transcriptional regulator
MADRPRTYLQRDTRRQKLLDLGLKLFSSRSYEDVSIEDVAREAGMSRGLLYHYFGGKRAFYTEVVRHAVDNLLERLVIDPDLSGPENLRRGLLDWFEFVHVQGDAYLAIMHGGIGVDDAVAPIIDEARRVLVDRILEGLEAEDPPPIVRLAIRSWIGAVETAALEWASQREPDPPVIVDVLMAGLFTQLLVASHHAPGARIKIDLAAGLRMLTPYLMKR